MSKLMNLRHLVAADETISAISEVGKLTSLQELSTFIVLKKHGHKIEELNHLTQLQGTLRIKNLENIVSEDEARKGKLNNKKFLEELQLEWAPPYNSSLEKKQLIVFEEVLEALKPHQSLKLLTIKGYKGARSPSWLKAEELYNLETLALVNCKRWKDLSYIVHLPRLKVLRIEEIPVIKQISTQFCGSTSSKFFPMLEELYLMNVCALEEIHNLEQLSYLKILHIMKMPSLRYIGTYSFCGPMEGIFFPVLEKLVLEGLLVLQEIPNLGQLPCLKILWIQRMPLLKSIGHLSYDSTERKSFPILKNLVLRDLLALEELPNLWQLPYLKTLHITKMPSLKYIGHPSYDSIEKKSIPMLEELVLEDLLVLEEIPNLEQLPCLKILHIKIMPSLKYIDHPSYDSIERKSQPILEELVLEDLFALEELPNLGQLPCLKVIHMMKIPAVKYFDNPLCGSTEGKFFPVLEKLWLEDLLALEEIYNLGQLSCLKMLRIRRLPSLKYIGHPSCDSLEWKNISFLEELVLDELSALEEFPNLGQLPCLKVIVMRKLSSLKYIGSLSCDLIKRSIFPVLQNLVLEELLELEEIPNLGQLPFLQRLVIVGIPRLKIIGHGFFGADKGKGFPCLKSLSLRGMPAWEEWSWPRDRVLFLCLDDFRICDCPKLKRLPPLPCSLRELFLQEVGLTELPRLCKEIESNSSDITGRLSALNIRRCPNLRSLEEGLLMYHLPNIRCIVISECEELMRLPLKGFKELTSLQRLAIRRCPKLMTQDEKFDLLPPSIEVLKFHGYGDLNKFQPSCLQNLISSITRLSIGNL